MFKFIDIAKSDLDKINQVRESLPGAEKLYSLKGGQNDSLTFPHETFTIGLSSLKEQKSPEPRSTGIRIIETEKNSFHTIYDINKMSGGGSAPHMSHDRKLLKDYEEAFSNILGSEMENKNYEVRTLRIPALYVDALWLHDPGNPETDYYLPVRTLDLFEKNRFYNKKDFYSILNKTASGYDADDELKGA